MSTSLLRPVFGFLLLALPLSAAPPATLDEVKLAARIDEQLAARWKKHNVVPAPSIDDAAFIRRAYLDLAGRIPSILEVRDFLDDDRAGKRRLLLDELLRGLRKDGGDSYSDHFAAVWGEWIVPPGDEERGPHQSIAFQSWLRTQLRDNVSYDVLVRRILQADTSSPDRIREAAAFLESHEHKPENLGAATARLFLGVKLDCAQCHDDRSGANWAREQFWELAAFFTPEHTIAIPGTKLRVQARFLDGTSPRWSKGEDPHVILAKWVTSADNPYFARALVNRVWAYLFGIGLVDPFDDHGEHNPPSHAELLAELAQQFTLHRFDLKYLLRALLLTQAYQRSSVATETSRDRPRLFAHMVVRGLSAAQLFDSLAEATEYHTDRATPNPYADASRRLLPREEFLTRFTSRDRSTETTTSILQALHLMNGPFMARATSLEHNRTLQTIADAARIDTARRLETLFLVALTRKPTAKELQRLTRYVDQGGPSKNPKKALADVFWALLNSAEFRLNH